MIETPQELAMLLYSMLLMQDHIFGGVACSGNAVVCDSNGKAFQVTVTRMEVIDPAIAARVANARNN